MKKLLMGLLLFFVLGSKMYAQEVDTVTYKYWYYPAQNIYYNESAGDYWYWDAPTVKWVEVRQLPSTFVITDADTRYMVSHKGNKVWLDNGKHKVKYKIKNNGTIKQKNHKSD